MANTFTSLHYHIVFSTKNRERWIMPDIEQRIWAYLGGIAKDNKMKPIQIGDIEDHVHLLLGSPATLAPSKMAQVIKGDADRQVRLAAIENLSGNDGELARAVLPGVLSDPDAEMRQAAEQAMGRR